MRSSNGLILQSSFAKAGLRAEMDNVVAGRSVRAEAEGALDQARHADRSRPANR
jgi:hypothetical protein